MRNSSKIVLASLAVVATTITASPARGAGSEYGPSIMACEPGSSTMGLFVDLGDGNHLTLIKFTGEGMVLTVSDAAGQKKSMPLDDEFSDSGLRKILEAFSAQTAPFRSAYCAALLPKINFAPGARARKLTKN